MQAERKLVYESEKFINQLTALSRSQVLVNSLKDKLIQGIKAFYRLKAKFSEEQLKAILHGPFFILQIPEKRITEHEKTLRDNGELPEKTDNQAGIPAEQDKPVEQQKNEEQKGEEQKEEPAAKKEDKEKKNRKQTAFEENKEQLLKQVNQCLDVLIDYTEMLKEVETDIYFPQNIEAKCTLADSGAVGQDQKKFTCKSCWFGTDRVCCEACAYICHKDHGGRTVLMWQGNLRLHIGYRRMQDFER